MIKTAEEIVRLLWLAGSGKEDEFKKVATEIIKADRIDAIKHGMTIAADAIQHGKDIDSVNTDLAWCQTAILTARDNLKEI